MSKAYLGPDGRPRVRGEWRGPRGVINSAKEFVIDSGANRTGLVSSNVIGHGLVLDGIISIGTAGRPYTVLELSGGELSFQASDRTGKPAMVTYRGTIIAPLSEDCLGMDALKSVGVKLTVNLVSGSVSLEKS